MLLLVAGQQLLGQTFPELCTVLFYFALFCYVFRSFWGGGFDRSDRSRDLDYLDPNHLNPNLLS